MAIYAIGDIQGCYTQLRTLLTNIKFKPDSDKLWFVGDIINRGPESLETIRFIKSLGDNAVVTLGNHDLHFLALVFGHGRKGKKDTIDDILSASDRDELVEWLLYRPLLHHEPLVNTVMVHAGIHPLWTIAQASSLAGEVEAVLRSTDCENYFKNMYGDKPMVWKDDLKNSARLRYITNVFTRMRYFNRKSRALALKDKGAPGNQPANIVPWFDVDYRKTSEINIVFGHWSTLKDPCKQGIYPLDTGCLWGGKLTALRIDLSLNMRYQLDCPQAQPVD